MGSALIADHTKEKPEGIKDHQYINMLEKSIICDETWESLEYRHVVRHDKQKNTFVKYFFNDLGYLEQRLGYRVKGTDTIFFLVHEKIPTERQKYVTYGQVV